MYEERNECLYCGALVGKGEHGYQYLHCNDRMCRAVSAFWDTHCCVPAHLYGRAMMKSQWRGPLVRYYLLADFLRRMSDPKTRRELEFSKRYAHRMPRPDGEA
jgi:hypothetical protein